MDANTITVQTTIAADASTVWELYTSPEHITRWNHASDDWHTTRAENDLREAGRFTFRMEAKDGSFGFDFTGTYVTVKPEELITYVMEDGRKASVTFTETDGATDVTVTFDAERTHTLEEQRSGWQAILDNFRHYVEAQ